MMDPFFYARLMPSARPPAPDRGWALFLDLDGTLLDIAPTPGEVVVPRQLVGDLVSASTALGGALAIVSGRMLTEIDSLLTPLKLPGGGEHGAVIRTSTGQIDEVDAKIPSQWVEAVTAATNGIPGILIEKKTHSVVVHYRRAPDQEAYCRRLCTSIIWGHEQDFELLHGRMAIEIRPQTVTKARPVHRLMSAEPFKDRTPVFVGDDVTDEDGFRAANKYGGKGLDVFAHFAGRPSEVRDWLKSFSAL